MIDGIRTPAIVADYRSLYSGIDLVCAHMVVDIELGALGSFPVKSPSYYAGLGTNATAQTYIG